mgnify:CR=1 FL=1
MGLSKTTLFTEQQNALAALAKALGHPARVAIVDHLLQAEACINSDLVQELGLAQATISQHLRELKDAGIIQGTIEGPRMSYCINPHRWEQVADMFSQFFGRYQQKPADGCC